MWSRGSQSGHALEVPERDFVLEIVSFFFFFWVEGTVTHSQNNEGISVFAKLI